MSKVFFTTRGPEGQIKTRGSAMDYGYTVAGWYRGFGGKWEVAFSRDEHTLRRTIRVANLFVSPVVKSTSKQQLAIDIASKL